MTQLDEELLPSEGSFSKYVRLFALATVIIVLIPAVLGYVSPPPGSRYLGYQYNLDDHMVYSAWMRQAMDGRFLFEDRFTTDPQPGLTAHLYFWTLGQFGRILPISVVATVARALLSGLFVLLLGRLIQRFKLTTYSSKLAVTLTVVGGGFGFLVWQNFGVDIDGGGGSLWQALSFGHLPVDVWQPEAFVFPSMLTNSLFMASLCLLLYALECVWLARDSWKPVAGGAVAMLALMNIHSYDVVIWTAIAGFLLAGALATRQATWAWAGRVAVIGAGAIPSALWFVHVLQSDPVFQARAATLTYSPTFRAMLMGVLPCLGLGLLALAPKRGSGGRHWTGTLALAGLVVVFAVFSAAQGDKYWLSWAAWAGATAAALGVAALVAQVRPNVMLVSGWACATLILPFLPELFQRKLMMGMVIPWAILAAIGLERVLAKVDRGARNMVSTLFILLISATSIRWIIREVNLIRLNVSNTTVHSVFVSRDANRIIAHLEGLGKTRKVIVAMPGVPYSQPDQPQSFQTPYIPDLNPILTGLTGAYTYAGHWSETPQYNRRRSELTRLYVGTDSLEERRAFLERIGADYVVAPVPEAYPQIQLVDLSPLGRVVVPGTQFQLIEFTRR